MDQLDPILLVVGFLSLVWLLWPRANGGDREAAAAAAEVQRARAGSKSRSGSSRGFGAASSAGAPAWSPSSAAAARIWERFGGARCRVTVACSADVLLAPGSEEARRARATLVELGAASDLYLLLDWSLLAGHRGDGEWAGVGAASMAEAEAHMTMAREQLLAAGVARARDEGDGGGGGGGGEGGVAWHKVLLHTSEAGHVACVRQLQPRVHISMAALAGGCAGDGAVALLVPHVPTIVRVAPEPPAPGTALAKAALSDGSVLQHTRRLESFFGVEQLLE
jgi:hypothetical protein